MGKTTTADEKVLLERLRADCDAAFHSWTAQVRVLQSVSAGEPQDRGAVEQARGWAEEAAAVYREKRNLLLEFIMHTQGAAGEAHRDAAGTLAASASGASQRDRTRQVERLARQIWEESGRPAGTAEADWFQAEQILQTRR
jgi:hypothetical protein